MWLWVPAAMPLVCPGAARPVRFCTAESAKTFPIFDLAAAGGGRWKRGFRLR
jgi:hypothetical protein